MPCSLTSIEVGRKSPRDSLLMEAFSPPPFTLAEIAQDLGVCTSAIAKAVRKMEGKV